MTAFSFLFRKKAQAEPANVLPSEVIPADTIISEDLFVDNQAPGTQSRDVQPHDVPSRVSMFLDQDYEMLGFTDGYNLHSGEVLQQKVKTMKAAFRMALEQDIDHARNRILQLRESVIEVELVSAEQKAKLEMYIDHLNDNIGRLQQQMELSALDEGWIMGAVHPYRKGFSTGVEEYLNLERMMNWGSLFDRNQ